MEFYGKMSFLKAGMAYSSHITTVSATYAQEITTPEFGCGLDGFLAAKTQQGLLSGIPNGIDESWDAATDTHLFRPSASATGKAKRSTPPMCANCLAWKTPRPAVRRGLATGLPERPGPDRSGLRIHRQNGGQIAIIGRGEPEEEQAMRELALRFPGRSACASASTKPTPGACSPAATSC
jgi:starch synthase